MDKKGFWLTNLEGKDYFTKDENLIEERAVSNYLEDTWVNKRMIFGIIFLYICEAVILSACVIFKNTMRAELLEGLTYIGISAFVCLLLLEGIYGVSKMRLKENDYLLHFIKSDEYKKQKKAYKKEEVKKAKEAELKREEWKEQDDSICN